jgi:hypothetical protein
MSEPASPDEALQWMAEHAERWSVVRDRINLVRDIAESDPIEVPAFGTPYCKHCRVDADKPHRDSCFQERARRIQQRARRLRDETERL